MQTAAHRAPDEAQNETQIRRRIEEFAQALRAKDRAAITALHAPGFLAFDLAPPLQHCGAEVGKGLSEWFATWDGPIGYEFRDLVVVAGDEIAFGHSLNRLSGRRRNGETTDVWFRATLCFRKIGGAWMVAHEHTSVPFYMDGSNRAAIDLRP